MLFGEVVATSAAVAETRGRLEKIDRLAALLRRLAPDEVDIAIAFLSGDIRQGRIGIGPAAIREARSAGAATDPALQLVDVDASLARLAESSGRGSTAARVALLRELLGRATPDEQQFLIRLLFGELRQGALEGILLEAVARASGISAAVIRRAVMMAGELSPVARTALVEGEPGLAKFAVRLFQPLQPMLAQPAVDLDDALSQLEGDVSLECKVDGARIQVHKAGDLITAYSRTLRDVTPAVPEVVEAVRALSVREAVLDGEVIALGQGGTPQPFQITMQRFGRKLDVERLRAELPLTPFFFDLVYLDGSSLVDEPQERRFAQLGAIAPSLVIPARIRPTRADAEAFLDEMLRRGHEGVMAKAPGAAYMAGRRGRSWLKIKVARTLDLVVLAAEWGHGRRTGWLSNLHLGARDPGTGAFVMLGKTFKGLTDEMLAWQTEKLLALEVARDDFTVYVRPELVVEVAFNDVQTSPHYPGGLALRFARVKSYRPDKRAAEADTIETVRQYAPAIPGRSQAT